MNFILQSVPIVEKGQGGQKIRKLRGCHGGSLIAFSGGRKEKRVFMPVDFAPDASCG